jgi:hypothetical protein
MAEDVVWRAANEIPPEWYESEWGALESLMRLLLDRRAMVRELITAFRTSLRNPFPHWRDN